MQGYTTSGPASSGQSGFLNVPTPEPGGTTTPGTNGNTTPPPAPDYASILANDPVYKQIQAQIAAQGISDASSRAAARQRALVQFGMVPDFNASAADLGLVGSDINTDITPDIAGLAAQNTQAGTSTYANLQTAYKNQVRQIKQSLAARELLSSGESGFQLGNAQHSYNQGLYDDTNKLTDLLASIQSAYNTAQQNEAGQLAAGAGDAYNRATAAAAAGQTIPPASAPPPPPGNTPPPPPPDNSQTSSTAQQIARAIFQNQNPYSNVHYGGAQL